MPLRKVIPLFLALLTVGVAQAQQADTTTRLLVGAHFTTRFDNREYTSSPIGDSRTYFSARLTPYVGLQWQQKNRLVVAVDLQQDFGDKTKFLSLARPQIYYQFNTANVQADAGIFDRRELAGDYSRALFGSAYSFYNNRLAGFMGRYVSTRRPHSYVELTFDWTGMKSEASREMFRIFSAGRYSFGPDFYFGYGLSMFHYAQSDLPDEQGVQDNMFVNPYVGADFTAFFDFDIKANFLVAPQRVRETGEGWKMPCGGQLDFSMSRWGVKLENNLYLGQNLQPYYGYGGADFYSGERFYGTDKHIYNRTWIGYGHSFFHDTVDVEAGIDLQYDGYALGTQQIIRLSLNFNRAIRLTHK